MDKLEKLAYEFGGAKATQRSVVTTLLGIEKDFATSISDETKLHLVAGLQLRYAENNKQLETGYIREGEAYVPVSESAFKSAKGDKIHLSVAFIMAESSAKFGRLKLDNPALHTLVKEPRAKIQRYVSDTLKDMQAVARRILNEGIEAKPRAPNKDFNEKVATHFEKMRTELIGSKSRGDETANEVLFRKAVVAFNTVWNHG